MNRDKAGVPDFVLLTEITEDAFMENLLKRYNADYIYVKFFFFFINQFNFFNWLDLYWRSSGFGESL